MRRDKLLAPQLGEYPEIAPVPATASRPLWSVMIPAYNCGQYLIETLRSVLDQDPGPEVMQIEVVDDCSTQDDSEAVVRSLGKGRVSFFGNHAMLAYRRILRLACGGRMAASCTSCIVMT